MILERLVGNFWLTAFRFVLYYKPNKVEISGGRIIVKKLSIVVTVVFFLVLLLSACGGSNAKNVSVSSTQKGNSTGGQVSSSDQTNATSVAHKPQPEATTIYQMKVEVDYNVSEKTCPAPGTVKLTSTELVEAAVNTICYIVGKEDQGFQFLPLAGTIILLTLAAVPDSSSSQTIYATLGSRNCDDCPKDYRIETFATKNPLGEWQLPTDNTYIEETKESAAASATRAANKDLQTAQQIVGQSKIEILAPSSPIDDKRYIYLQLGFENPKPILQFNLLGQLANGTTHVFLCDRPVSPGVLQPCYETDGNDQGQTPIIKAYQLILLTFVNGGWFKSDWVFFNK